MLDTTRFRDAHYGYLNTVLEWAVTYIQMAEVQAYLDREAASHAIAKATEAVEIVTELIRPEVLTVKQESMILSRRDAVEGNIRAVQERVGLILEEVQPDHAIPNIQP